MKKKNKKTPKITALNISKVAVFCLIIGVLGMLGSILTKNAFAVAVWEDPVITLPDLPPAFPTGIEPPINTSISTQEKKGGLSVATENGSLIVGSDLLTSSAVLEVQGDSYFEGNMQIDGNLSLDDNIVAGGEFSALDAALLDLSVNGNLFRVDSNTDSVGINTNPGGFAKLTIQGGTISALAVLNASATSPAMQVANISTLNGSGGLYAYGQSYGVTGVATNSSTGYGVLADASAMGTAAMYAKAGDTRYGAVGRGLYGVVGLDNSENIDNPVINGPAGTLAALFQGSVAITPSAGGNADLTVDGDTFVVNSSTDKVGIGISNPLAKLDVSGENDQSVIYARTADNSSIANYGGPTATVAGLYAESGTVTYNGIDNGWNFGVFSRAGDPGTGRTIGIMGVGYSGGGDTYAGWFDGEVKVDGQLSVIGPVTVDGSVEAGGNIVGYGDLDIAGDSLVEGDLTHYGKLVMTGGLPVYNGGTAACTTGTAPDDFAEGTMIVCYWCTSPAAYRQHAIMTRMNSTWRNIGSTTGSRCDTGDYVPET